MQAAVSAAVARADEAEGKLLEQVERAGAEAVARD